MCILLHQDKNPSKIAQVQDLCALRDWTGLLQNPSLQRRNPVNNTSEAKSEDRECFPDPREKEKGVETELPLLEQASKDTL